MFCLQRRCRQVSYLEQTAEGSTDVCLDGLLPLTLQLIHCLHKLLQYLHSTTHTQFLLKHKLLLLKKTMTWRFLRYL